MDDVEDRIRWLSDNWRSFLGDMLCEITDHMIYRRSDGTVGLILCHPQIEADDHHCDRCFQELLIYSFKGPEEHPRYFYSMVGPTKFSRIKSGERDFLVENGEGFSLRLDECEICEGVNHGKD